MKITGKYDQRNCDGVFKVEMDLIEYEMMRDLMAMAQFQVESAPTASKFDHAYLSAFCADFDIQASSLVCEPISRDMLMRNLLAECNMAVN